MTTTPQISSVGEGDIWPAHGAFQPLADCFAGTTCRPLLFEGSPWIFFILLLIIGGGCAYMAGRSLAVGWQPAGIAVIYGLLLACAVRFLHFGLLRGTLLSPWYFAINALVLIAIGLAGYRYTRAGQMATQYPWLYRRFGPFGWTAVDVGKKAATAIAGADQNR